MEALLKSDLCGWTDDRMLVLRDWSSKPKLLARLTTVLKAEAAEITDAVLFYYVGHGLLVEGGKHLGMALTGTDEQLSWRKQTSLLLDEVRDVLSPLVRAKKIEIIDCCYSGIASNTQASATALQERVARATRDDTNSRYTVTASRRNEEALYQEADNGLTYFTSFLREIVTRGIEGAPPGLTMSKIYPELYDSFQQLSLAAVHESGPLPTQLASAMGGEFLFASNAVFRLAGPVLPEPDPAPAPLITSYHEGYPDSKRVPRRNRRVILAAGAVVVLLGAGILTLHWSGGQGPQRQVGSPTSPATSSVSGTQPVLTSGVPVPVNPAITLTDPMGTGANSVVFTPDGRLVVGDLNGSSYLWDVNDAQVTATLSDVSGQGIFGISYSPHGTIIAASTDNNPTYSKGSVVLWNASTGKLIATLIDPQGQGVGSPVAISPDGGTLAAADSNGGIYLWNTATDELTGVLHDPYYPRDYGLAFSPTSGFLAAADQDGAVFVWDTQHSSIVTTFQDPQSKGVISVAFSPDGATLATGDTNGNLYLWNVATGALMSTLTGEKGGTFWSIAFSPGEKILAATDNDTKGKNFQICVWDTKGKLLATFHNPDSYGATRLAFSPDGRFLAVGDENAHTYLWSIAEFG